MALKVSNLLAFGNIEHFDLSITISNCNSILITEGDRTDIVIDLAGLIKTSDLG